MNSPQMLYINIALGALTAVANGAAAMMMIGDPQRSLAQVGEATLFAVIGFALVVIGAIALAGRMPLARALRWQSGALAALLLLLTLWGTTILFAKSGQPLAVSWMVGILSALAIYLFFLVKRTVEARTFESLRLPLLIACGIAIVVDLGVFARVGWL
jgi:Ca2+/Na+ antiporter